jgi:hypothetical protein
MAVAHGTASTAALPGAAPGQRAKRSDEESLLPPNRGQAWHEKDLTGSSSSVEENLGGGCSCLQGMEKGCERVASRMRVRTGEWDRWVAPSSPEWGGVR